MEESRSLDSASSPSYNNLMGGARNVRSGRCAPGFTQNLAVLTIYVSLCIPLAGAANENQDFEAWPTTAAWGTTMHEGWTLSDGQVKGGRGGFGPPLGDIGQCGWLYDFDDSTNSWIQSPLFEPGVLSLSLWTRRNTSNTNLVTNFAVVQTSSNGADWVNGDAFTISVFDWTQQVFNVDTFGPTFVRIVKTGDDAANAYVGLDDIEVTARPAVYLSNLTRSTVVPTLPEEIDIFVDALIHPTGSNIVITTYYRRNTNDAFTAISMTLDEGDTYKTLSPIPLAGFPNGIEYYVEAIFDEGGPAQVFLPPGGPNAPVFYSMIELTGETAPRQLGPSSDTTPFIISEIMYHPADSAGSNNLEYIEIFNTDPVPRDISGYRISGDADYRFPPNTIMQFRSYLVVARDPSAVQQAYGISNVVGPLRNNLSNNGGRVRLRNHVNALMLEVNYGDRLPWPKGADGAGHSLQLYSPDYGEGDVRAWGQSAFVGGSPGKFEPPPVDALRDVLINEYLAHTDLPDVDYIELYNSGTQSVDISGCGLSNTLTTNEYVVPPATILPPGGFVFYEQTTLGFSLRAGGDEIYLWAPDFSYIVDAAEFDAEVNGVSSGRFPDGASTFHALDAKTPGAANSSAALLIRDVVINEIMFSPLSGKDRDEYVELYNKSTNVVDLSFWRFVDGIDYLFPEGTQIPAGGYLVVAGDLDNLLFRYPQLNTNNALGNFSGRLSNSGERIALAKPDDPDLPFVDLVIVDEMTYGDAEIWGKWIDGGGSSLELIDPRSDNRLAPNWRGSDETAKSSWITIERTGVLDQGTLDLSRQFASTLDVFLAQEGECLVDDIEVIQQGDVTNRISNSGFDSGIAGWVADGTHWLSSYEAAEGFSAAGSLHLRSSGGGAIEGWVPYVVHNEVNHVSGTLAPTPLPGEIFTIRAKARWLAGWPYCILGFDGHWLEATGELAVPADLGSPGLQNSSYSNNIGPAIFELAHLPTLPAVSQTVTVTCRAHDPDGVASVTLEYRIDPSAVYNAVSMLDDGTGGDALAGDGVYSAQFPGQASGTIVAFRVKAIDSHASPETSWSPSDELKKNALVRFGEPTPSGMLGTYMVWISSANEAEFTSRDPGGNQLHDITFVYDNYRSIYNSGIRFRGNGRGGPVGTGKYKLGVPDSERVLGNDDIAIDFATPHFMSALLEEGHSYLVAREAGVPATYIRYVVTRVNGSYLLRHHHQTPTRDFVKRWYGDSDPVVFKGKAYDPFANYIRSDGMRAKAKYRYGERRKRTTVPSDSFDTLYNVASATTVLSDNAAYIARMAAMLDIYRFGAYFAVNSVVNNGDTYGAAFPRHTFFNLSPTHRGGLHLHDMDNAYPQGIDGSEPSLRNKIGEIGSFMFSLPEFNRHYWRVQKDMAEGPLDPAASVPELQGRYDVLVSYGLQGEGPEDLMEFDANRQTLIMNTVPTAPFAILGGDFNTPDNIVILEGSAPVDVTSFRINVNGLRVSYPTETNWLAIVGLNDGPNTFLVEGLDRHGNTNGSDSVIVTLTTAAPSPVDQLVITEIMYHSTGQEADYVEIYNRSAETFDLGDWRLNGVDLVFEKGALIGPGEYRIAAENITAYQHNYRTAETVIGDFKGNLDNGGETLTLEMPIGSNTWMEIDKVRYDNSGAWPTNADGAGASLQLIDLNADNSRAGNWGAVEAPEWESHTPATANSNAAALFTFPLLWINEVMPSNTTTIMDNFGEFEPWLELYNADTVAHDLSLYWLSNDYADLERWAFPTGTIINSGERLCIWADGETNETAAGFLHADFRLNSVTGAVILARQWMGAPVVVDYLDYDSVAPDNSFGSFPDGDPFSRIVFQTPTPSTSNSLTSPPIQVVVNEWMADNETFLADPSDGSFDDWFELYNPSAIAANLTGHYLTDNLSITNMFAVPSGTIVPANGFLFVWADNDEAVNGPGQDLHVNFGLSRNGDTIGLYSPAGGLVDAVVFGAQRNDQSDGSWPDAAVDVYPMLPCTPGDSNSTFIIINPDPEPGGFTFDMVAVTGTVYRVEFNDDMVTTNWMLLDIITADTSIISFTDTNYVAVPSRFYRLLVN